MVAARSSLCATFAIPATNSAMTAHTSHAENTSIQNMPTISTPAHQNGLSKSGLRRLTRRA